MRRWGGDIQFILTWIIFVAAPELNQSRLERVHKLMEAERVVDRNNPAYRELLLTGGHRNVSMEEIEGVFNDTEALGKKMDPLIKEWSNKVAASLAFVPSREAKEGEEKKKVWEWKALVDEILQTYFETREAMMYLKKMTDIWERQNMDLLVRAAR